jgi:hypothetical protein
MQSAGTVAATSFLNKTPSGNSLGLNFGYGAGMLKGDGRMDRKLLDEIKSSSYITVGSERGLL